MSIKLNTVAGTYAKRTLPLIGWIYSLFHSDESSIRNALKTVVHDVHYGKAKTLYLYDAFNKIEVKNNFTGECVAIELNCFEDKTVQCETYGYEICRSVRSRFVGLGAKFFKNYLTVVQVCDIT